MCADVSEGDRMMDILPSYIVGLVLFSIMALLWNILPVKDKM